MCTDASRAVTALRLEPNPKGDEVVIARANKPVVRLVALNHEPARHILGLNASTQAWIAEDYDAPTADEASWYGEVDPEPTSPDPQTKATNKTRTPSRR